MPRELNRLTPLTVKAAKAPGYQADGGGLYLQITDSGSKSWVFRYERSGKRRELGLGPCHTISLAEAREKATRLRKLLLDGIDPFLERQKQRADAAKVMTFDECASEFIRDKEAGWSNTKHADQWQNTLDTYASPIIGKLPVGSIDTALVLKVLRPIWTTKPETASRVQGRIAAVLGWATVNGHRSGSNPAQWKNHLDKVLPGRNSVAKVEHHSALPYVRVGEFMAALRNQEGAGARALELAILTACRSGEVRGARWQEFDLTTGTWTIPPERMKAKKEHVVALSAPAVVLLTVLKEQSTGSLVFPGSKPESAISDMTLTATIRRMHAASVDSGGAGWADKNSSIVTAHGFRSTFRDWAGETTAYPREVIEHALAHQLKDKAEAAYQRGTLLDKRRKLMQAWADYCASPTALAGVMPINAKAAA